MENKTHLVTGYIRVKVEILLQDNEEADEAMEQAIEDLKNGFSPTPAKVEYESYEIFSDEKVRG